MQKHARHETTKMRGITPACAKAEKSKLGSILSYASCKATDVRGDAASVLELLCVRGTGNGKSLADDGLMCSRATGVFSVLFHLHLETFFSVLVVEHALLGIAESLHVAAPMESKVGERHGARKCRIGGQDSGVVAWRGAMISMISAKSYGQKGDDGREMGREMSRWIGRWGVHGSDLVGVLCHFELALGLAVAVVFVGM
jgi:hypothetical protein